jgi:uncharacterized membrane-anchored protein YhcB (DUF1043 family)
MFSGHAQNVTDTVHPLFKGELDGDKIREQFSDTYARGVPLKKSAEPYISFTTFYSSALKLTGQFAHEKIPELKAFRIGNPSVYELSSDGYIANYAFPVFDSTGIIVTVYGINHGNAGNYEFRVVENKTREIIPWRVPTLFCETYILTTNSDGTEQKECAYLGQFRNSFGNSLTIEVRKKGTEKILASTSALWINRAPNVLGIFTQDNMAAFLSVFKNQWQHDIFMLSTPAERKANDTLLQLKKKFSSDETSLIFYLDDKVRSKEIIEYNLVHGTKNSGWKSNDFDLNLIWLKNLSPGKYSLQIRYSIQRHNITSYSFTITPAWHQTLTFKVVSGIVIAALIGFIFMVFRARKHRKRLADSELHKKQTQLELRTIRSQFNPHFVFNALTSIQGLITKNDMDGANKYLTEFSTLLRDSLKESGNENISLATEMRILDTYLKLEQLRFGFTYNISAEDTIDKNGVEIPSFLLQPLVENAVKHGVSSLFEKGNIDIRFKSSTTDLLASISDNGKGYKRNKNHNGFGLKLTKERIALLNSVILGRSIHSSENSMSTGTEIILVFKNWLS